MTPPTIPGRASVTASPTPWFCLLAVVLFASPAWAQIGFRQLTSVEPVAVQRGKTSTIQVRSNYTLDGCYQAFTDGKGVALTFAETEKKEAPRRGRGSSGTPFAFTAEVAADAPLGIREVRCATPVAVSSCSMLLVTDLPVVQEEEKNDTIETAQPVELPAAICGVCQRREDVDVYRFDAKKGETYVFDVYAQRVTEKIHSMVAGGGAYHMDAILGVFDANGTLLVENDNTNGGDPWLAFTAPRDGSFFLSLRDVRYHGDQRYTYCIEASIGPEVTGVFPLSVAASGPTNLELRGAALGDQPTYAFTPSGEQLGWQQVEIPVGDQVTGPVWVKVTDLPRLLESATEGPTDFTIPAAIDGRVASDREVDQFRFEAKKGEAFTFAVEARPYGSQLDSVLRVRNADGKVLTENDDSGPGRDAAITFTAPADGAFTLEVADLHGRGGADFPYHLVAERAVPDFEFTGEFSYAMVAPNTRFMWFVKATRKHGFSGPISFRVEGLPKGVDFEPLTLPPTMTQAALILKGAKDAPVNASLVRVVGTADVEGPDGKPRTIERTGQPTIELQSQGGGQGRWPTNTQLVGVSKGLDLLSATVTPTELTLSPGEKATLEVTIERAESFAEQPVNLAMDFKYFNSVLGAQLPPGVEVVANESDARLGPKTNTGKVTLQVGSDAKPVERLPIAPLLRVSITFSITTNYCTNPVYLTIVPEGAKAKKGKDLAAAEKDAPPPASKKE